jgi:Ribosomal protein L5
VAENVKQVAKEGANYVPSEPNRLLVHYKTNVIPQLVKHFGYQNINEVPKIVKVVVNTGLGDAKDNSKSFQLFVEELKNITGQKPIITNAKKSVANFKVRQGMAVGAKVTLRNVRMYEFLDKLMSVALPRVRDFRGVPTGSFDGRGNYTLGVKEQLIFPEIVYDQVEKTRGFDISIVTTAKSDEEAKELLALMGMPFKA